MGGLHDDEGHRVNNVLNRRAVGKVVHRPPHPLEHGTAGPGPGAAQHRLVDDVARVEVGVQTGETTLEFDYGWQAQTWLRLTPNGQGILRRGGTGRVPDARVAGLKVDAEF